MIRFAGIRSSDDRLQLPTRLDFCARFVSSPCLAVSAPPASAAENRGGSAFGALPKRVEVGAHLELAHSENWKDALSNSGGAERLPGKDLGVIGSPLKSLESIINRGELARRPFHGLERAPVHPPLASLRTTDDSVTRPQWGT